MTALFDMAVVMDKLEVLVDMSFGRLRYPFGSSVKRRRSSMRIISGEILRISGDFWWKAEA